jgi:hypothetical protein
MGARGVANVLGCDEGARSWTLGTLAGGRAASRGLQSVVSGGVLVMSMNLRRGRGKWNKAGVPMVLAVTNWLFSASCFVGVGQRNRRGMPEKEIPTLAVWTPPSSIRSKNLRLCHTGHNSRFAFLFVIEGFRMLWAYMSLFPQGPLVATEYNHARIGESDCSLQS